MASYEGAFAVAVVINGAFARTFAVDSGASDVVISADVVSALMKKGLLTSADFTGEGTATMADGSKIRSKSIVIRSLKVGNVVVENVEADVSPAHSELLLGQTFFQRFSAWTIDNDNRVLLLKRASN